MVFPLRRRDRGYRDRFIQLVPVVELAAALALLAFPAAKLSLPEICGLGLTFSAGSLGRLLAVVAALLWAGTGAVSPPYFASAEGCNRYYFFWLLTQGALMGVFLAGDLFTLFVFFEMMSFTSYVWVAQNETPQALRAAETYLAVAVIGRHDAAGGAAVAGASAGDPGVCPAAGAGRPGWRRRTAAAVWCGRVLPGGLRAPRQGCSPAHLASQGHPWPLRRLRHCCPGS